MQRRDSFPQACLGNLARIRKRRDSSEGCGFAPRAYGRGRSGMAALFVAGWHFGGLRSSGARSSGLQSSGIRSTGSRSTGLRSTVLPKRPRIRAPSIRPQRKANDRRSGRPALSPPDSPAGPYLRDTYCPSTVLGRQSSHTSAPPHTPFHKQNSLDSKELSGKDDLSRGRSGRTLKLPAGVRCACIFEKNPSVRRKTEEHSCLPIGK